MRPNPYPVDAPPEVTTAHLSLVRSRADVRADRFTGEADDPFAVDEDSSPVSELWYADEVAIAL